VSCCTFIGGGACQGNDYLGHQLELLSAEDLQNPVNILVFRLLFAVSFILEIGQCILCNLLKMNVIF
jgi:hypothetical protein